MAANQTASKVQQSLGLVQGTKVYSPFPFGGMNLQASSIAMGDQEFLLLENWFRLGDGNLRTAWDAGVALYTAPSGKRIVSFFFYTVGAAYYVAVFFDDGTGVQVDAVTGATEVMTGGAFWVTGGSLPACAQWGTLYLIISNRNTSNDYWIWEPANAFHSTGLLYQSGTFAPAGVTLLATGSNYTSAPTATAYGGHGSGSILVPTVNAGGVVQVNITNPGTGYEVGDVVQVAFAGGGGDTTPVLTSYLSAGGVAAANITARGGHYTSATAVISGGGGSGATADVTVGSGIASVTITAPGINYTFANVSFSGGSGSGAVGIVTLVGGTVVGIIITNPGTGYTSTPTVAFSGDGSGAAGTAVIQNGEVTGITVTSPGTGYTSAPTIAISGPGGSGATAVAILNPTSVAGTTTLTGGTGFTSAPNVSFLGGGGSGARGVVILVGTSIARVDVTSGGQNYQTNPTVSFVGGNPGGATATAQVANGGQVVFITVTNAGAGYTTNVEVLITPAPGDTGAGATAIAVFAPTSIDYVQMSAGGKDYTDAPAVVIAPGANNSAYAIVDLMPFGISGDALETFQSRVWIANPAPSPISDLPPGGDWAVSSPNSLIDFATSDGGLLFTNSDGFLQTKYTGIRQSSGYLYFFGDGSASVVSNVQSSGSPVTTTLNYQNVDPQTGLSWRDSLQDFSRSLLVANETGVYGLYGGAMTKVSDKLNELFNQAIFPPDGRALVPSAAVATVFDVRHYLMLMTMADPYTGLPVNKMIAWNEREWSIAVQTPALTYIGPQKVESRFQAWGTDGDKLYPLFSSPSGALAKRLETKLYGGGQSGFIIKDLLGFYIQAQDRSAAASGIDIAVSYAVSGLAVQSTNYGSVPNGVYPAIQFAPVQFNALAPYFPLFAVGVGGLPFIAISARLATTSPDFVLGNFFMTYLDQTAVV